MNEFIQIVVVYVLFVFFVIILYEVVYVYVVKFFGDIMVYLMGCMSFNLFKYIDFFGIIFIFIMLYFVINGVFLFGYVKLVLINFGYLCKFKCDMVWVLLVGFVVNFFMVLLWMLVIYVLVLGGVQEEFFILMVRVGVLINLVMFVFNLFLILLLDGGCIFISLLLNKYVYKFVQIEFYGFFIVMVLVLFKVIYVWWMVFVMYVVGKLLQFIIFFIILLF